MTLSRSTLNALRSSAALFLAAAVIAAVPTPAQAANPTLTVNNGGVWKAHAEYGVAAKRFCFRVYHGVSNSYANLTVSRTPSGPALYIATDQGGDEQQVCFNASQASGSQFYWKLDFVGSGDFTGSDSGYGSF